MVHISEAIKVKVDGRCKCSEGQTVEYQGSPVKTYFVNEISNDIGSGLAPKSLGGSKLKLNAAGRLGSFLSLNMSSVGASAAKGLDKLKSLTGVNKKSQLGLEVGQKSSSALEKANGASSNIVMATEETEDMPDSYTPSTGRDPRIKRWTLKFVDDSLEMEYQAAYIDKCVGKMATSVVFTTFMTLLLFIIDVVVYTKEPAVYIIKSFAFVFEAILFFLVIARLEEPDNQPKWMVHFISWSRSINYQALGPTIILILFATTIPQLTISKGVFGLMAYHYATLHITIMMSAVFDRSRALYISASTYAVVVLILSNLNGNFLSGNSDDKATAVTTWGFIVLMSLALSWIMNRMEYQVRYNYLMKRELIEKKYEIQDIRVKAEKMLYTLLPKEIVMRYDLRRVISKWLILCRLRENPGSIIADNIEEAAILFCNVVNFKTFSEETMVVLNDLVCKFDQALAIYQIEKIKSIGMSKASVGFLNCFLSFDTTLHVGYYFSCASFDVPRRTFRQPHRHHVHGGCRIIRRS